MRRSLGRAATSVLRAGVLVMLSGGCAKILGVDDYRVEARQDAGSPPASFHFYSSDCGACTEARCEGELAACEADGACRDEATCSLACGGSDKNTCLYDCLTSAKESSAMKALNTCIIRRCTSACVSCGYPFVRQGSTCGDCVEADTTPGGICELTNDCLTDPDCLGYLACMSTECDELGETDPECRLYCGMKFPEAARFYYQTVGTRYFTGCAGPCNAGSHWLCQQPPAWPPVSTPNPRITLRLPSTSLGASVRACKVDDYGCKTPFLPAATDAATDLLFVVPGGTNVFFDIQDPQGPVLFAPQQPTEGDLLLWAPGVTTPDSVVSAAAERGETVDMTEHGAVEVLVADCVGGLADYQTATPQTTITASTGSKAYYNADPAALGGGIAWFINVPPDSTTIEVFQGGARQQGGRVPIRAGVVTVVTFNYPQWY